MPFDIKRDFQEPMAHIAGEGDDAELPALVLHGNPYRGELDVAQPSKKTPLWRRLLWPLDRLSTFHCWLGFRRHVWEMMCEQCGAFRCENCGTWKDTKFSNWRVRFIVHTLHENKTPRSTPQRPATSSDADFRMAWSVYSEEEP